MLLYQNNAYRSYHDRSRGLRPRDTGGQFDILGGGAGSIARRIVEL